MPKPGRGFWDGKRVLVAGGGGFIGSHLVELLVKTTKAKVAVADRMTDERRRNLKAVIKDVDVRNVDLRTAGAARRACRGQELVLNLAAKVAGVGYNSKHHATMFRENMRLSLELLEGARLAGVGRFVVVSSACVYPREAPVPTPETEGFRGRPEETNEGYGWAKRMSEYLGAAYQEEFGMEVAVARPYNAYGPRDHFEPEKSHVIAALIRRVFEGEDPLVVWGDGKSTRSFLYVEDFARGLMLAAEKGTPDPVNLGTDEEVSIKSLAESIVRLSGKGVSLRFDPSKPSGQPRRNCAVGKARSAYGFEAKVDLEEGLSRTIAWYRAEKGRK